MATSTVEDVVDPKYIKYLLDPKADYDCYIVVGNPSIAPVEKIGVVPKMLFAHSAVMRTDLQVKNIQEKVPFKIVDILPNTFKNLLRFVYGHDITSSLCFDDADNLLYAAEKYMISDLKNNVAVRLMALLNAENICSLMNNPTCYQAYELNSLITKVLQNETSKVFASAHFLELTSDSFVKILQQEALNVKEIDVWRNAIKWAKHKAKSEVGDKLRKSLAKPLRHIRLCTLSAEELCKEVLPTKVLSGDEGVAVGISVGNGQKQTELTEICQEVEVRRLSSVKSAAISKVMTLGSLYAYSKDGNFVLETKDLGVELSSLTLCSTGYVSGNGYAWNFTVSMEQVTKPETKTSVAFTRHNLHGDVTIPISTEDREVLLLPNTQYKINISCNYLFNLYSSSTLPDTDHFSSITYGTSSGCYTGNGTPFQGTSYCIKKIDYKTINL